MNDRLHILRHLAQRYERSKAGRTGESKTPLTFDYEEFLADAGCATGELRVVAEKELVLAERAGILQRVTHSRDPRLFLRLRFLPQSEPQLYALLRQPSPHTQREALAAQFTGAAATELPEQWQSKWRAWCGRMTEAARTGGRIAPLNRENTAETAELLALLPRLLAWEGESLIRFVSCVLCGDSKRLGELSSKIGRILADLSDDEISGLEALGILETPRSVLLYGPVRFCREGQWVELNVFAGPVRLSEADITQAEAVDTTATRCLTVENETTFHELAKLRSGVLLICTSFPGSATRAFLQRLPGALEFWHFGDTDPAGYEVLRDLRERTSKPFKSLHMQFRGDPDSPVLTAGEKRTLQRLAECPLMREELVTLQEILSSGHKGRFEQESLGRPTMPWPFYR